MNSPVFWTIVLCSWCMLTCKLPTQKQNLVQGFLHLSVSYQTGICFRKSVDHIYLFYHANTSACTACNHARQTTIRLTVIPIKECMEFDYQNSPNAAFWSEFSLEMMKTYQVFCFFPLHVCDWQCQVQDRGSFCSWNQIGDSKGRCTVIQSLEVLNGWWSQTAFVFSKLLSRKKKRVPCC